MTEQDFSLQELEAELARRNTTDAETAAFETGYDLGELEQELSTRQGADTNIFTALSHAAEGGTFEDAGVATRFSLGLAESVLGTWYGVQDLFGAMDDEEKEYMRRIRNSLDTAGTAGTIGNITGEIAQFIVPGGAAIKGARALGKAKNALALARAGKSTAAAATPAVSTGAALTGEVAGGGLLGYAQLPDEAQGETRGSNAAWAAVGPLIGRGIAKAGGTALEGIKTSAAARKAMAEGVELTPGLAASRVPNIGSSFTQLMESLTRITPGLARGTRELRENAVNQWANNTVRQVGDKLGLKNVNGFSTGGIRRLREGMERKYNEAWAKAGPVSQETADSLNDIVARYSDRLRKSERGQLRGLASDISDVVGKNNPDTVRALDGNLAKLRGKNDTINRAVGEMKEALRAGANPAGRDLLSQADAIYPEYLVIRNAARQAQKKTGKSAVDPMMLQRAADKVGARGEKLALGEAPLQRRAQLGLRTVVDPDESSILNTVNQNVAKVTASPTGLMKALGRVGTGQAGYQKALRPSLRRARAFYNRELRPRGISPGSVYQGYAASNDTDR